MGFASKIVWVSDLHLTEDGVADGAPCRARLEQLVAQINKYHGDAVCCIATGDLTHNGTPEEYAVLAEVLTDLKLPSLPMIGNHDHRETLCTAFPPPGPALPGYMQYRWDLGETVLLCLDTQDPGKDSGIMDGPRLEWVRSELALLTDRRVLVFMHHPPGPLGLGPLDDMPLVDHEPLMDILGSAPQVAHLFCGHVHRPVSGIINGVPFATLRSTSHQTRPPYEDWGWDNYVAVHETPQYGVILLGDDRVVVQTLDIENTG